MPHTRMTTTAQKSCETRKKPPPPPPGPPGPPPPPPPPVLNTRADWLDLPNFYHLAGVTENEARDCGAWLCARAGGADVKLNYHDCDAGTNVTFTYLGWMGCFEDGPFAEPPEAPGYCADPDVPPPCP